ncbi:hypothetical protein H8959_009249 [Pygathrix nigripes]
MKVKAQLDNCSVRRTRRKGIEGVDETRSWDPDEKERVPLHFCLGLVQRSKQAAHERRGSKARGMSPGIRPASEPQTDPLLCSSPVPARRMVRAGLYLPEIFLPDGKDVRQASRPPLAAPERARCKDGKQTVESSGAELDTALKEEMR